MDENLHNIDDSKDESVNRLENGEKDAGEAVYKEDSNLQESGLDKLLESEQVDEKQDLNINDFLDKEELNNVVETSALESEIESLQALATESTDPEILNELAQSEYDSVRLEVSKNENTPEETLQTLANDDSFGVAEYAKMNLDSDYKPENPEFLDLASNDSSESVRDMVASNEATSIDTLQEMAKNETSADVLDSIIDNPQLNEQSVDKSSSENAESKDEEKGFLSSLKDTIDEGVARAKDAYNSTIGKGEFWSSVADVAVNRNELKAFEATDENKLDNLADKKDSVKEIVAMNANTSSGTLDKIANTDTNADVKIAVASNNNTNSQTLDKLYEESSKFDQKVDVALNEYNVAGKTDEKTTKLEFTAKDSADGEQIREAIAGNKNTSENTLDKLSYNESASVRAEVGANEKSPEYVLDKLATDESKEVRASVLNNDNVSDKALGILSNDADNSIKESALAKISERSAGQESSTEQKTEVTEDKREHWEKSMDESLAKVSEISEFKDVPESKTEETKEADVSAPKESEVLNFDEYKDIQRDGSVDKESVKDAMADFKADRNSSEIGSDEFKEAQRGFEDSQLVLRNGLNQDDLDSFANKAIERGQLTDETAEAFKNNTNENADKLVEAGILEKQDNGDFKFVDEKAREILADNLGADYKDLADMNMEAYKDAKSEVDKESAVEAKSEVSEAKADATEAKEAETPVEQKEESKGMAASFADTIKELDANPEKAHEMASHLEASANSDFAIDRASAEALDRLDQKTMADHEAKSEKGGMAQSFNDEVKRQEAENHKQEQTADVASSSEDKQATNQQQQNIMRDAASF